MALISPFPSINLLRQIPNSSHFIQKQIIFLPPNLEGPQTPGKFYNTKQIEGEGQVFGEFLLLITRPWEMHVFGRQKI